MTLLKDGGGMGGKEEGRLFLIKYAKEVDFVLGSTNEPKTPKIRLFISNKLRRAIAMATKQGAHTTKPQQTAMYKLATILKDDNSDYSAFAKRIKKAFPIQTGPQMPHKILDRFGVDWKYSFKIPEGLKETFSLPDPAALPDHSEGEAGIEEEGSAEPKEAASDNSTTIQALVEKVKTLSATLEQLKSNLSAHQHLPDNNVVVIKKLQGV